MNSINQRTKKECKRCDFCSKVIDGAPYIVREGERVLDFCNASQAAKWFRREYQLELDLRSDAYYLLAAWQD